jgi:hypothetical protein
MNELETLISKYERGIAIHNRMIDNPKSSNIQKNRSSHLLGLCEVIVDDLKEINNHSVLVSKSVRNG